jgi:hypothetical protein
VLFPTNFSDACRQTGRALAQLAAVSRLDVTLLHVIPAGGNRDRAHDELASFLTEANAYDTCRRMVISADQPASAVSELCRHRRFDVVMAPASERLGMTSFFTSSLRGSLLKRCPVPLWTAGASLPRIRLRERIRTVGCLLDFDDDSTSYLPLVTAFAARFNARLRVLHVIPPVDDGTLAQTLTSDAPLRPEAALSRVQDIFTRQSCPEVDVTVGHCRLELRRMVERADVDLLFVGPSHTAQGGRFLRHLDRLPCPVVYISGEASRATRWTFQDAFLYTDADGAGFADEEEIAG